MNGISCNLFEGVGDITVSVSLTGMEVLVLTAIELMGVDVGWMFTEVSTTVNGTQLLSIIIISPIKNFDLITLTTFVCILIKP